MHDAKRVSDVCKYYYNIKNERCMEDDCIAKEILDHYSTLVEMTNLLDEVEKKRIISFDECVYAYFNDSKFKEIIELELMKLDKEKGLVEIMIDTYKNYQNASTLVATTKWI